MFTQMTFEHFGHQAIDSTAYGRYLLQYGCAILALIQGFFNGFCLPLNASNPG